VLRRPAVILLATGVAIALSTALPPVPSAAQNVPTKRLRIGTKEAPPFSFKAEDGSWRGISIDLWRQIASDLHLDYDLEEHDLAGLLDGLRDGSLDAAVAALTMTADRERAFDFSHAFYTSGLGIAAPRGGSRWRAALLQVFSWQFLQAAAALAIVLLAAGFAVWLFERRRNPQQFGGGAVRGVASGFWWSAVTMTTVGYGDKAPVTTGGRLVALLWMFASIITISGFTAAIASTLTVSRLESSIQGPEDLANVRVATVPGSASAAYLRQHHIRSFDYPDIDAALQAVAAGAVDAVVYDAPILRYDVAGESGDALHVLPFTLERQDYAIGLPAQSALEEPINRTLLAIIQSDGWKRILDTYLEGQP
jgi:polar amino acid transport system substrate-binding protein